MEVIHMNSSKFLSMLVVMGLVANTALPMGFDELDAAADFTARATAQADVVAAPAAAATEAVAQTGLTAQAREAIAGLAGSAWETAGNVVVLAKDHPYVSGGAVATVTLGTTTYVVLKNGLHKPVVNFVSTLPRLAIGSAAAATAIGGAAVAQHKGLVDFTTIPGRVRNAQFNRPSLPSWVRMPAMPSVTLPAFSLESVRGLLPSMTRQNAAIATIAAAVIGGTEASRRGYLAAPAAAVTSAASSAGSLVVPVSGGASASADAAAPVAAPVKAKYTVPAQISAAIARSETGPEVQASIDALIVPVIKEQLQRELDAKKAA